MSARDAFLAAIHEAPDDDAPRLVFADWLEENGEPERAEFIRIQVEMRREYEAHGRTERLEELFIRSREVFYQPWADLVRAAFGRGVGFYSRGFPRHSSAVYLTAAEAVSGLPALASWLGPLGMVALQDAAGGLKDVAAIEELRFVRCLEVQRRPQRDSKPVTDAEVADLVASPHVAGLRTLELVGHRLGDEAASAIAGSPWLRQLEVLNLNHNRIGRPGAQSLAAAPGLASLTHLHLANNQIGDAAVKAILHSPYLKGLTTLELRGNSFGRRVSRQIRERFPAPPAEEVTYVHALPPFGRRPSPLR